MSNNQQNLSKYDHEVHFDDFILQVESGKSENSNYEKFAERFDTLVYSKQIPQNLRGLHRKIEYSLEFSIGEQYIDTNKYNDKECFVAIVDICSNDYYIDSEEIDSNEFEYWENHKMNIEQMKTFSKKYMYFFKIPFRYDNSFIQNQTFFFAKKISIDFHLRYGNANYMGFTEHQLNQNFDIVSNCFQFEEKDNLKNSKKSKILREHLSNSQNLILINLDEYIADSIQHVPVANLVLLEPAKISTLITVLLGMFYLLRKLRKYQLKQINIIQIKT